MASYTKHKGLFSRKRPPRIVTILGVKLKVKVVEKLVDGSTDLLGAYNHDTKTIYLLKHPDWPSCLFHELAHAALAITGAGEGLTLAKEESICIALESAFVPLLF